MTLPLLGACNMVISETPMFVEGDRRESHQETGSGSARRTSANSTPEAGIRVARMRDAGAVVRNSGRELNIMDSKKIAAGHRDVRRGHPAIIEGKWVDDAKEPAKATYGYYGKRRSPLNCTGVVLGDPPPRGMRG